MARLQILELPEGSGDDRPPFVLVVDEISYPDVDSYQVAEAWWRQLAQQVGAQGCIVTTDTMEIPGNEVPLDADDNPIFLKMHVEGDFEQFREQVQDEIAKAQQEMREAIDRRA